MKILKIENNVGMFLVSDGNFLEIDRITKEHLIEIINLTLANDVIFDAYDEEKLLNPAQRIIYKNISEKMRDLASRRQEYKDEVEKLFQKEYDKYTQAE
jgi:hypothetical protein